MIIYFFSLQSKRKSDPKKGRSQSSSEDVVWFSFIRAFCCFLSSTSPVLFTCDAFMLVVYAVVSFYFFRRKFLLPRLVGLWRKKWLQLHSKVWKRRPPVVALLRRLVSQRRVSRLSRILRLSNFLHPKVPNPSRLLVLSKLCYLRWG